ncbi:MAG: 3-phosphoshikimate 1-carboxyvinyltransferase [archaeon]
MRKIDAVKKLNAVFNAPPSKAHTLRALFIASLADGKSFLRNALYADDQRHAANALALFGARIDFDGKDFIVHGTAGKLVAPHKEVFVGNSGVTARFLVPLAALANGNSVITGDARLKERPVSGLVSALEKLGAEASASENGSFPVKVKGGGLEGGKTIVEGSESSQFLSAILVSAPYTEKGVLAKVSGELKSGPYVDITIDCMKSFGVLCVNHDYTEFFVKGKEMYKAQDYEIEGDYSSASYFFAAAAITGGKAKVNNLNPYSSQGDKKFLDLVSKMGCSLKKGKDFIEVKGKPMKGIGVDMADCPDIVPSIAVVAAVAKGKTKITGISHLAAKESNRIESVAKNLEKCGVKCRYGADFLEIDGGKPHGTAINSFNDHRIAMAFSVLGLKTGGMIIDDEKVVSKSFPNFFGELENAYEGKE